VAVPTSVGRQPAQQAPPLQRLRLRYAKRGRRRFIRLRDVSRAFERAVFRARIPMAYSSGFNVSEDAAPAAPARPTRSRKKAAAPEPEQAAVSEEAPTQEPAEEAEAGAGAAAVPLFQVPETTPKRRRRPSKSTEAPVEAPA
jgi:hypothetical protein